MVAPSSYVRWARLGIAFSSPGSLRRLSNWNGKLRGCLLPTSGYRFSSTAASTASINSNARFNIPTSSIPSSHSNESADTSGSLASSFLSLESSIHPLTLKAITQKPFNHTNMSPVQSKVLPLLPGLAKPYDSSSSKSGNRSESEQDSPRDLLVKAKTGTGKTLAFLVPSIEARLLSIQQQAKKALQDAGLVGDRAFEARAKRKFASESVGTLVISPTRELATQIANEALKLTSHHEGFEVKLFVGGESKRAQIRDWTRGRKDLVVATPGRLRDLLTSEPDIANAMSKTQQLILDEADSLLDMGFRDDIDAITGYLPPTPERQTFLFSATVSPAIRQVARATLASNHLFINCVTDDDAPVHTHIKQYHTVLPSASQQVPHILRLLAHDQLVNAGASKSIVFLPTTKMTQLFTTLLRELKTTTLPAGKNTRVYEIHSKRTMESRTRTSADFRADKSGAAVLVSSDVSARGVDYPGVTRVIQVGIPSTRDQYVHRVGRTGRSGEGGREGRGDLVLLPWEMGFVTWQLTDVPLKPLTVGEMDKQVKELAAKIDEDVSGHFEAHGPPVEKGVARNTHQQGGFGVRGRTVRAPVGPALFANQPYAPAADEITKSVEDLKDQIDDEVVNETFMSLLGYYVARTSEIRIDKMAVLEGCKEWAVDVGGMSRAPHVSTMMLQKLGLDDNVRVSKARSSPGWASRDKKYGTRGSTPAWRERENRGPREEDRREGRKAWGIDRGKAVADWRNREERVKGMEREGRAGRSWTSGNGRRGDRSREVRDGW
ncbi:hypothetical protein AX17_004912 [Amanita inopinata Kibby_2008]|nr:hypothetical protein AX17_004912 [Amanita inopinata Kibby_2008]